MRGRRIAALALAACLATVAVGCRAAARPPATMATVLPGDALVDEGCYDCLHAARDAYDALPAGPLRSSRLFAVSVLIGLRQSELAMDSTTAFARARALAPDLPPAADAGFVLELASVIPPDSLGTPRTEMAAHLERARQFWAAHPNVRDRLARAELPAVLRGYLAASIPCLTTAIGGNAGTVDTAAQPLPPILEYRSATCPVPRPDALERVARRNDRFTEAAYVLARAPTLEVTPAHLDMQRAAFDRAGAAFPTSPSVAYSRASWLQTTGDCRAAIAAYDNVLAVSPGHEAAALQRIICLGYERRHENAINAATVAIEAGLDLDGDFHYWRAWNRHQLRQLVDAGDDIDVALQTRRDAEAFTLGGIVRYELGDFPAAERHLSTAVQLDGSQCLARWYLGLVAFARELWIATGDDFAAAADCYGLAVRTSEDALVALEQSSPEPDTRAQRAARLRSSIADDRNQAHASSLNAAIGFARSGDAARARAMLAAIPVDSPHAAGARELGRFLDETSPGTR